MGRRPYIRRRRVPWREREAPSLGAGPGAECTDGPRVTTINAELGTTERRRAILPSPGTLGLAAATGLVLFEAVDALLGSHGLGATLHAGWSQLVAPAFVLLAPAAVACERLWPAERRPFLARGHVQDASYFLLYILAIAPFMTLLSVGSAVMLRSHATWLQATWTAQWPRWTVVVVTLLAMDLCNWLAHWGDHRFGTLWRVHALHHSQEELSVLTSFRAHPLMHTTGFLLATVPVLLLMPTRPIAPVLITIYVCVGTLQHANLRWTFGPLGRMIVSPAYHRLHHAPDIQRANLGVVLTIWDVLAGSARFPARRPAAGPPGRAGRPAPVKQDSCAASALVRMAGQLIEPFPAARPGSGS